MVAGATGGEVAGATGGEVAGATGGEVEGAVGGQVDPEELLEKQKKEQEEHEKEMKVRHYSRCFLHTVMYIYIPVSPISSPLLPPPLSPFLWWTLLSSC